MGDDLQVYINIPFCIRPGILSGQPAIVGDPATRRAYLEALRAEMQAALPTLHRYRIADIVVGGYSPSVMDPDRLAGLMRWFRKQARVEPYAQTEICMVPQTVCTASLTGLGVGGFNRTSLSMVSAVDSELRTMDAGFTVEQLQYAILFLDRFRYNDLDLRLVYGIPGQTERSWTTTLHAVRDFAPTHVTLEPFSQLAGPAAQADGETGEKPAVLPVDTGLEVRLLEQAHDYLPTLGLEAYTAQHLARAGHRSAFVMNRASGMEYLGFGLGARSFIDGMTYADTCDLSTYLAHPADFETITTQVVQLSPAQLDDYRARCHELLLA